MNNTFEPFYKSYFTATLTKNLIIIILCTGINSINCLLIHIFHKHEIFSTKPRYILFVHMVINDMVHLILTVLLLTLTFALFLLPVPLCTTFVLVLICTTENTPLNVACMALECYIAICHPLHHNNICTVKRTYSVIAFIWLLSVISGMSDLFITLATSPLDFFNGKVACDRTTVFPSELVAQKRNYFFTVLLFIVWFVILYSYLRVFFSAKAMNKDAKKARNTIILHGFQVLMCMTTYASPPLKDFLIRLFPKSRGDILFAVYVAVQVLPKSLSPIVYGIKDTAFRKHVKIYLMCRAVSFNKPL